MGSADRIIRSSLALVIAALSIGRVIRGTLAIVLGVFAAMFAITSAVARCPAYLPLKISTRKQPGGVGTRPTPVGHKAA